MWVLARELSNMYNNIPDRFGIYSICREWYRLLIDQIG